MSKGLGWRSSSSALVVLQSGYPDQSFDISTSTYGATVLDISGLHMFLAEVRFTMEVLLSLRATTDLLKF